MRFCAASAFFVHGPEFSKAGYSEGRLKDNWDEWNEWYRGGMREDFSVKRAKQWPESDAAQSTRRSALARTGSAMQMGGRGSVRAVFSEGGPPEPMA